VEVGGSWLAKGIDYHSGVLSLGSGDVHVWYTAPAPSSQDDLDRLALLLSADERHTNSQFMSSERRRDHLVGRALVRTTLSRYASVAAPEWIFTTGRFGRPEIVGPAGAPPLRFSLTHSPGLIAVAVALNIAPGLDVAYLDQRIDVETVARQYFAVAEAADLASCPAELRRRRFFEYWTLKEAYLKATGLGLSIPLNSFAMTLSEPPTIAFANGDAREAAAWQFRQPVLSEAHVAALAVRGKVEGVQATEMAELAAGG
jgi:4'-phosphopantetheinyl transferase